MFEANILRDVLRSSRRNSLQAHASPAPRDHRRLPLLPSGGYGAGCTAYDMVLGRKSGSEQLYLAGRCPG